MREISLLKRNAVQTLAASEMDQALERISATSSVVVRFTIDNTDIPVYQSPKSEAEPDPLKKRFYITPLLLPVKGNDGLVQKEVKIDNEFCKITIRLRLYDDDARSAALALINQQHGLGSVTISQIDRLHVQSLEIAVTSPLKSARFEQEIVENPQERTIPLVFTCPKDDIAEVEAALNSLKFVAKVGVLSLLLVTETS